MELKEMETYKDFAANPPKGQQCTYVLSQEQINYQYYEEFKRLYQTAFLLDLQMKQLMCVKEEIINKLAKIEKKTIELTSGSKSESQEKKKRFRRTAEEIDRPFLCSVEKCQRTYGSEGSLQQHIKLKHPELYVERMRSENNSELSGSQ